MFGCVAGAMLCVALIPRTKDKTGAILQFGILALAALTSLVAALGWLASVGGTEKWYIVLMFGFLLAAALGSIVHALERRFEDFKEE